MTARRRPDGVGRGAWARGDRLTLVARPGESAITPGIEQALRDGIERGFEGDLPATAAGAERFIVRAAGIDAGVIVLRRDVPHPGAATFVAIAIDPEERGHSLGARALFAAERRLARDGIGALYARVPRGNGRGLYFVLRCGYAPASPPVTDGATWFRRADA